MPNLALNGDVNRPMRVVAPMSVKRIEVDLDTSCIGTAVNHNIDAIILHGTVEVFFYHRIQPVNFINKKHPFIEIGK